MPRRNDATSERSARSIGGSHPGGSASIITNKPLESFALAEIERCTHFHPQAEWLDRCPMPRAIVARLASAGVVVVRVVSCTLLAGNGGK